MKNKCSLNKFKKKPSLFTTLILASIILNGNDFSQNNLQAEGTPRIIESGMKKNEGVGDIRDIYMDIYKRYLIITLELNTTADLFFKKHINFNSGQIEQWIHILDIFINTDNDTTTGGIGFIGIQDESGFDFCININICFNYADESTGKNFGMVLVRKDMSQKMPKGIIYKPFIFYKFYRLKQNVPPEEMFFHDMREQAKMRRGGSMIMGSDKIRILVPYEELRLKPGSEIRYSYADQTLNPPQLSKNISTLLGEHKHHGKEK